MSNELEQKAREIAGEVLSKPFCDIESAPYQAALEAFQLKQKEVDELKEAMEPWQHRSQLGTKLHKAEMEYKALQERCERLEDFKKGTRELLIRIYRDGIRKHRNIGEAIRKAELDMEYIDFEQALTNASPTGEEVESE